MKGEIFINLVLVNHLLLQQVIQILILQHHLPQNGRLRKCGDKKLVETPSKLAFFCSYKTQRFHIFTWFMSSLKFGPPQLLFEVFLTKTKTELF